MAISGNFDRFKYFDFATNFLHNKNLLQKTGVRFLVKSTKIENASFSLQNFHVGNKCSDK